MVGIFGLQGDDTIVQVRRIGDTRWLTVPGLSSWRETGSQGRQSQIKELVGSSGATPPASRTGEVTCEASGFFPLNSAWELLRGASASIGHEAVLEFRMITPEKLIFRSNPALEANLTGGFFRTRLRDEPPTGPEGIPDLADETRYAPGMAIKTLGNDNYRFDGELYIITDILVSDEASAARVDPARATDGGIGRQGAVVPVDRLGKRSTPTAVDYEIVIPRMIRGPFAATVRGADRLDTRAAGDVTTQLSLHPRAPLPPLRVYEVIKDLAAGSDYNAGDIDGLGELIGILIPDRDDIARTRYNAFATPNNDIDDTGPTLAEVPATDRLFVHRVTASADVNDASTWGEMLVEITLNNGNTILYSNTRPVRAADRPRNRYRGNRDAPEDLELKAGWPRGIIIHGKTPGRGFVGDKNQFRWRLENSDTWSAWIDAGDDVCVCGLVRSPTDRADGAGDAGFAGIVYTPAVIAGATFEIEIRASGSSLGGDSDLDVRFPRASIVVQVPETDELDNADLKG